MNNRAFALLELLLVVAVIAILAVGGFYIAGKNQPNPTEQVKTGIGAEESAKQVVGQINSRNGVEENAMNNLNGTSTPTRTMSPKDIKPE